MNFIRCQDGTLLNLDQVQTISAQYGFPSRNPDGETPWNINADMETSRKLIATRPSRDEADAFIRSLSIAVGVAPEWDFFTDAESESEFRQDAEAAGEESPVTITQLGPVRNPGPDPFDDCDFSDDPFGEKAGSANG